MEDIPTRHLFAVDLLAAPKKRFVAFGRAAVRMVSVGAQTNEQVG